MGRQARQLSSSGFYHVIFRGVNHQHMDDGEICRRIMHYTKGVEPHEIGSWAKAKRDSMLRQLKEAGLSIRQIERVTGISRGVVAKS
jgi:putative transposase